MYKCKLRTQVIPDLYVILPVFAYFILREKLDQEVKTRYCDNKS